MPTWKKTIVLKDLLTDEEYQGGTYEDEKRVCSEIAVEISKRLKAWPKPTLTIEDIIFDLEDTGSHGDADEHYINMMLNGIYNEADQDRVWIG